MPKSKSALDCDAHYVDCYVENSITLSLLIIIKPLIEFSDVNFHNFRHFGFRLKCEGSHVASEPIKNHFKLLMENRYKLFIG